jgi:Ca2+/Na+ antiporter
MEFLHAFLMVGHFIGLAAIVGPFLLQMRRNSDFAIAAVLGGAITQLVTGIALTGLAAAEIENYPKIFVKLGIALVVFVAALLGWLRARKSGNTRAVKPFFHAAGGLALVNIVIAVFW